MEDEEGADREPGRPEVQLVDRVLVLERRVDEYELRRSAEDHARIRRRLLVGAVAHVEMHELAQPRAVDPTLCEGGRLLRHVDGEETRVALPSPAA